MYKAGILTRMPALYIYAPLTPDSNKSGAIHYLFHLLRLILQTTFLMKQLPFLIFLLLSGTGFSFGQNKNLERKYALKLYNMSSHEQQEEPFASGIFTGTTTDKDVRLLHPTIAFRIKNNRNNMHEIELTNLDLGSVSSESVLQYTPGAVVPFSGGKTKQTYIALRYEYILNFMKNRDSRWMPALGLAAMPYYKRSSYSPVLQTEFPIAETRTGVKAFVIPRLNYALTSRLFLDLNIPLCVADMNIQHNSKKNPNLPVAEQKNNTGNFEGVPGFYSIRLGLGLNI